MPQVKQLKRKGTYFSFQFYIYTVHKGGEDKAEGRKYLVAIIGSWRSYCIHTQEAKSKWKVEPGYKASKPAPTDQLPQKASVYQRSYDLP